MKLLGIDAESISSTEDSAITAFHDELCDKRGQSLYLFHATIHDYTVIPSYILNNVKDSIEKFVNYVNRVDKGRGSNYVISVRRVARLSFQQIDEEFEFYIVIELLPDLSINYYPTVSLLNQKGDTIYDISEIKNYIEEEIFRINNRYMMKLIGYETNPFIADSAFYAKNTSIEISEKRIFNDIANAVNDGKSGCKILSCCDSRWVSKTLLKELLRYNFNITITEPDVNVTWEKYKGKILQYDYDNKNYFEITFERLIQILEDSSYNITVVD